MSISFSDASLTLVPGVWAKSGVELNSRLRGFLAALRVRHGRNLVVTSGVRSTQAQASAMRTKVQMGGVGELDIYPASLRTEVVEGGTGSTAAIKATLDKQVARGVYMSRHMRGDALDFRTTGMASDDLGDLKADVKALGANYLYEPTPPHLHVEDIPSHFAALDPVVLGGATVAAGFLWWSLSDDY